MTDWLSIPDRFERAARTSPGVDAVRVDGRSTSYRTLGELADRAAHALLDGGLRRGDRVALLFDRDEGAVGSVLGGMKSGGIVVPLWPSHPAERLRQILDDAEPATIVTDRRHAADAASLAGGGIRVIVIDEAPPAPERTWPALGASDLACLLYTSGSTGQPKGVMLSQGCLVDKFERGWAVFQPSRGDRLTLFSNYSLGQGISSILLAVLTGATSCAFDVRRDGLTGLPHWLARERITCYLSSASTFRSLARTLDRPPLLPDLRVMRIGGERVTPDDVADHRRLFAGTQLIVTYSSTETGCLAFHRVAPDATFPDGIVPLGRPSSGITVKILDEEGRERADGEEGEIVVQGPHLVDGYWRDSGRTAAAFRPAIDAPGERIFCTGDLGRLRADGVLEHRGRKDLRVKIRGFRIEIEDIETALSQAPAVASVAVAARPDAAGDLRLVAYVQPAPGGSSGVEQLRRHLSGRLPEHMIPSQFVFMDHLPTTDSGKVARRDLPDPGPERPPIEEPWVEPRSELESEIAAVWREVLGLTHVGVNDPFLAVGGDSLKATLVASRLEVRLGVEVPLWVMFEASTVAELAAAIGQRTAAGR